MTAHERVWAFQPARMRRLLQSPCWWLTLAAEQPGAAGLPISGDDVARVLKLDPRPATRDDKVWRSFSKQPDSPRFPTPPFARVPLTDRKKK